MHAKNRIEYVKEITSRIQAVADAKLIHPSPQIILRTLDNKKYSITYDDKRKKFSVVQRLVIGDMSESELIDFASRTRATHP